MELIGLLMREHRLIEQIVAPLETELVHISHYNIAHQGFIFEAVDFFRSYADRFHHGKEEDILFVALREKELEPGLAGIMNELVEEHRFARKTVGALVEATERWSHGESEALADISDNLRKLIELYPKHIEKEDKRFFFPCQEYFSKEERRRLLEAGYRFDKEFMNEYYSNRMKKLLEHR